MNTILSFCTLEKLKELVKSNDNFSAVLKLFNIKNNGNNITNLKKTLKDNSIDFSHFRPPTNIAKENYDIYRKKEYLEFIIRWKTGLEKGWTGKTFRVMNSVRKYLFIKYNNKCCKCGWCEIHTITKKVPLECNHIDGNPSNCKEENLELLCPNCHSLTPNFRNLNKDSCRIRK